MPVEGAVIRRSTAEVYFIEKLHRRHVLDMKSLHAYGLAGWVVQVPDDQVDRTPLGPNLTPVPSDFIRRSTGEIYHLEAGKRRHVTTMEVLSTRFPEADVRNIPDGDVDSITLGLEINEPIKGASPALGDCWAGAEKDAALCYNRCREGFHGVGPVCWGSCPTGYSDDGGTCRRDVHIVTKSSYGRGIGTVPGCGEKEYDAGLCYNRCREGFHGVGPVCWGSCPTGYSDDGGTCRRDAHIFAKSSYGRGAGYLTRGDYHGIFYRYIRDHHNIWKPSANSLREDEKQYLRQFFPERLVSSVGVVELEGMTGAFSHTASATTYGNDLIVIRKGQRSMGLLKHEFVHVCQYDQVGSGTFANMYADQYVDGGYDYNNIEFERQAFGFEPTNQTIVGYLGYCN